MRTTATLSASATFALTMLLLTSLPAYAYLDPGTGSVFFQGIIGSIAATSVILRVYGHRFLRFLNFKKQLAKKDTTNQPPYLSKVTHIK